MKILIIAKTYHVSSSARAVQMRRVVEALQTHTEHKITLITHGTQEKNTASEKLTILNVSTKENFTLIKRTFDRLICSLFCLKESGFTNEAIRIAEQSLQQENFDILFTVSTPFDSHLAGLHLKKKFPDLKWVSFFSDIWPFSLLPKPYYRQKLFSFIEEHLVHEVLTNSDKILTPSEFAVDIFRKRNNLHGEISAISHCLGTYIPRKTNESNQGYIVHSGSLQKERINTAIVEAVKELEDNESFRGLIHIGAYDKSLKDLIKKFNCKKLKLVGKLSEEEAIEQQSNYSIGIIIEGKMGDTSPFMPSKITDSIQLHQRLIFITPKNSFLSEFSRGRDGFFSCQYDKNEIKKNIIAAITSKSSIDDESINYFAPKVIAKNYDLVFTNLLRPQKSQ